MIYSFPLTTTNWYDTMLFLRMKMTDQDIVNIKYDITTAIHQGKNRGIVYSGQCWFKFRIKRNDSFAGVNKRYLSYIH